MVSPSFSEFQFTYGLTRELEGPTPGIGLIDLPRIPTQNQEAKIPADMVSSLQDGTTKLAPLFIQYKRSEWMIRSNAGQWETLEKQGINLSDGYFRFQPYLGDTRQHNKLVELGKQQPLVFYAAPMFVSNDEYLRYALNENLFKNTAFIQPRTLEKIDNEDHYITYTSANNGQKGVMCSEPTTFPVRSGVETVFSAGEIENRLTSFDRLRGEFEELRTEIMLNFSQRRPVEPYYHDEFYSENPNIWMRQQQEFFRNSIGTDLLFFTD